MSSIKDRLKMFEKKDTPNPNPNPEAPAAKRLNVKRSSVGNAQNAQEPSAAPTDDSKHASSPSESESAAKASVPAEASAESTSAPRTAGGIKSKIAFLSKTAPLEPVRPSSTPNKVPGKLKATTFESHSDTKADTEEPRPNSMSKTTGPGKLKSNFLEQAQAHTSADHGGESARAGGGGGGGGIAARLKMLQGSGGVPMPMPGMALPGMALPGMSHSMESKSDTESTKVETHVRSSSISHTQMARPTKPKGRRPKSQNHADDMATLINLERLDFERECQALLNERSSFDTDPVLVENIVPALNPDVTITDSSLDALAPQESQPAIKEPEPENKEDASEPPLQVELITASLTQLVPEEAQPVMNEALEVKGEEAPAFAKESSSAPETQLQTKDEVTEKVPEAANEDSIVGADRSTVDIAEVNLKPSAEAIGAVIDAEIPHIAQEDDPPAASLLENVEASNFPDAARPAAETLSLTPSEGAEVKAETQVPPQDGPNTNHAHLPTTSETPTTDIDTIDVSSAVAAPTAAPLPSDTESIAPAVPAASQSNGSSSVASVAEDSATEPIAPAVPAPSQSNGSSSVASVAEDAVPIVETTPNA